MKYTNLILFAAIFALFAVSGCHKPQPLETSQPVYLDKNIDRASVLAAAEDVMKDMQFVVEKSDAQNGYLKTRPLSGGEFFEFWRKDNPDAKSLAYSSIHSTQRTVEINLVPDNDRMVLACDVQIQRLAVPSNSISDFTDLPRSVSKSSTSKQNLNVKKPLEAKMSWEDLGKDEKLSAYIINRINCKLQQSQQRN
jgi:hypothetical protein